jgi:hypothetical protein
MSKTMEDKIFGAGCNHLWGLLQGLKETAVRSLELAGGDEELAREAYEKYVDEELLQEQADKHDAATIEMTRDILISVFDGAVAHYEAA